MSGPESKDFYSPNLMDNNNSNIGGSDDIPPSVQQAARTFYASSKNVSDSKSMLSKHIADHTRNFNYATQTHDTYNDSLESKIEQGHHMQQADETCSLMKEELRRLRYHLDIRLDALDVLRDYNKRYGLVNNKNYSEERLKARCEGVIRDATSNIAT